MAKKPLELSKDTDSNTTKNLTLKPKEIGNKNSSFSKILKKYQTVLISFALVLVLLVGGSLAYFQIQKNNKDNAKAGLNCPSGYNSNGTDCYQDIARPQNNQLGCPSGGQLENNTCNSYVADQLKTAFNQSFCPGGYSLVPGANPIMTDQELDGSSYTPSVLCVLTAGTLNNNISFQQKDSCPSGYKVVTGSYGTFVDYSFLFQESGNSGTKSLCVSNNFASSFKTAFNQNSCPSGYKVVTGSYGTFVDYSFLFHMSDQESDGSVNSPSALCVNNSPYNSYPATTVSTTPGNCPGTSVAVDGSTCRYTTSPSSYTIDANTGISACSPSRNNLNSGDTFNCTFNLSGSPTGSYTIPPEGLFGGIRNTSGDANTFLGNSDLCTVSGTVLTCNNIPTTGASIGSKEIILHQPNVNWYPNKGNINIATNFNPNDDTDGDGIPNGRECNQTGTNCPDTDNDGVPDYQDPDSDNDGILDKDEKGSTCATLTNCVPVDTDGDGIPDFRDTDSDNDGVWDLIEGNDGNKDGKNDLNLTVDPTGKINGFTDTNKDGLDDRLAGKTNTLQDTDNDGKKDFVDDNDDNDSVPTKYEDANNNGNWSDDDTNNNGIPAYLDPSESPDNRLTDRIFFPPTTLTESPNPQTDGLKIFGNNDYSLTLKDPRLTENSKTSICYFKIKEVTATDSDSTRGYEKLSSTILSSSTPGATYDATTKSYKASYDATNGVNIQLTKANQKYTDYNLQIRCTRSDNQLFGRDQKINFLFGAYSVVDISGVAR